MLAAKLNKERRRGKRHENLPTALKLVSCILHQTLEDGNVRGEATDKALNPSEQSKAINK